jgi:hypothetical protein
MNIQNNATSISLKLETLEKDMQNTKTQYEQAYKNYIELLKSPEVSKKFQVLKGRAYTGGKVLSLSKGFVKDISSCQANCSETPSCKGATYNSVNKLCYTAENGSIVPSTENTYAIVTNLENSILTLKALNDKLLYLTNEANVIIAQSKPVYDNKMSNTKAKKIELDNEYEKLLEQQREIRKLLDEYQTLRSDKMDTGLRVNQNAMGYNLFWALFLCLLYLFFMMIFDITPNNLVLTMLIVSFIFYMLRMLVISGIILFLTILYVILR